MRLTLSYKLCKLRSLKLGPHSAKKRLSRVADLRKQYREMKYHCVLEVSCSNPMPNENIRTIMSKIVICIVLTILSTTGSASECFGIAYASDKFPSSIEQTRIFAQNYRAVDESVEAAKLPGRIIIRPTRLESIPLEIARIQKGFVHHFVGAFINDGIVYWSGIDLDRALAIVVRRKIYDMRAQMTRPFGDPVFKSWDKESFARKWTSEERTETEVVLRRRLTPDEAEAFTCVANALWKSDDKQQSMRPSDTFLSNNTLLDNTNEGNAIVLYKKFVNRVGPLDSVLNNIWNTMPVFEFPGAQAFSAESRQEGQSCNSNSDCLGSLKCIEAICKKGE